MKKSYLFLLFAMISFAGKTSAQTQPILPCKADEMTRRIDAMDPQFLQNQKNYYEQQINSAMKKIDLGKVAMTTQVDQLGNTSFWYDIPVVVHIIHDYNNFNNAFEWLTDDFIYQALEDWNTVYAKQNSDTSDVIAPYKGLIPNSNQWYIGNPHIRLHLASIDPNGNPTHGITRHRSYLTYIGGDQSKLDDWPNTSYVNIWSVNQMDAANGSAAAYAYFPSEAANIPYWDGVIAISSYIDQGGASSPGSGSSYKTINHELGHVFNLWHPWGANNAPDPLSTGGDTGPCGDDNVDDTPPTKGHYVANGTLTTPSSTENAINDTACAENYSKNYTNSVGGDSTVNYPDTTNVQNIMDYSYIAKMFTYGQVVRMHTALNSTTASRNNLWDTTNLQLTGVLDASDNFIGRVDLKPIPDFSASKGGVADASNYVSKLDYFVFPGVNVSFYNQSWNDTITNLTWSFSNGASVPTSTTTGASVINSFTQPGWVTLAMTATGNHTADPSITWDSTITWPRAVFVANATGTPAGNIVETFSTADTTNWPFFNYYGNQFKWKIANVGVDDDFSLEYVGYDTTITSTSYPVTGTPTGDVDDFFSIPVDFTGYSAGNCYLNFNYSGAFRSATGSSLDNTDTLEIDYTIGGSWTKLTILSKSSLDNMGNVSTPYTPTSRGNWAQQSIVIPAAAITNYTTFRFQYRPGVGQASPYTGQQYSGGNNFYMDNIGFSPYPASVSNVNMNNTDVAVVPNPTSGDAYVILKDVNNNNSIANIIVTDVTGKIVYTISQQVTGNTAEVEIPHAAISVKGMYIVRAITGAKTYTQKLVVY